MTTLQRLQAIRDEIEEHKNKVKPKWVENEDEIYKIMYAYWTGLNNAQAIIDKHIKELKGETE